MKKKSLIKVFQITLAILIGLGAALTAKGEGEEFPENGWIVALIASGCILSFVELACKMIEKRAFKWKGLFLNVVLAMVSYFINYFFLV